MAAVESNETLLDEPKPLHYAENSQRFASFAEKIVHVLLNTETDDKTSYRCVIVRHANDGAMHGAHQTLTVYFHHTNARVSEGE